MSRLIDYARVVGRWWWLAALPLAVVLALTALAFQPAGLSYQVVTRYAVGAAPEQAPGAYAYDRYYTWITSDYMARGLAGVVGTGAFADAVARRLNDQGVQMTAAQVQGGLAADYSNSLLVVYATRPDAAGAARLAEETSVELTQHPGAYWAQAEGLSGAVRALDAANPVPVATSLRDRFDLPARVLAALAVGVALAFLAHAIDPRLRDRRDAERLGLAVIAEIPRSSS
jgi:capsular polysaccharide biosynthesis protein